MRTKEYNVIVTLGAVCAWRLRRNTTTCVLKTVFAGWTIKLTWLISQQTFIYAHLSTATSNISRKQKGAKDQWTFHPNLFNVVKLYNRGKQCTWHAHATSDGHYMQELTSRAKWKDPREMLCFHSPAHTCCNVLLPLLPIFSPFMESEECGLFLEA